MVKITLFCCQWKIDHSLTKTEIYCEMCENSLGNTEIHFKSAEIRPTPQLM